MWMSKQELAKARGAFVQLKNTWSSRLLSQRTQIRLFDSNMKSVLLNSAETRRMTNATQNQMHTWIEYTLWKPAPNINRQDLTWNPQGKKRLAEKYLAKMLGRYQEDEPHLEPVGNKVTGQRALQVSWWWRRIFHYLSAAIKTYFMSLCNTAIFIFSSSSQLY